MPVNVEKLGIRVVKSLDEIRTTGVDPKDTDNIPAKPVESRINALYRAIGLPAFKEIKQDGEKNKDKYERDSHNVANIFKLSESGAQNSILKQAQTRNSKFLEIIDENKQRQFLDNNSDSLISSLESRDKGSLFPMIVDGDLKYYPQSKRVAGAFFAKNSDIKKNDVTYRRPLIELITLLRMRSDGHNDTEVQNKVDAGFEALNYKDEDGNDVSFFEGSKKNILLLEIIVGLKNSILDPAGIPKEVDNIIKQLGSIRKQYRDTLKDQRANVPEQNPTSAGSDGTGTAEELRTARDTLSGENEARMSLLEYEDIYGSKTKNMREAMFADIVVNVMLSDTSSIKREIEKTGVQKEKAQTKIKTLWTKMDMMLGTFSSVSGLDVLVIIAALFTIDERYLFGLLNAQTIDRLEKDEYKGPGSGSPREADVTTAIDALQEKVKDIYELIDRTVATRVQSEKGRQKQQEDK